jgi:hypothetical protein
MKEICSKNRDNFRWFSGRKEERKKGRERERGKEGRKFMDKS